MTEKEQKIALVIEYLKSLRDEIHIRIQEHTRLVWIKIISLGAIISFLMGKFYGTTTNSESLTPLLSYFVWIIPLAAIIFDMLIAGNMRDINNLGHYIKKYVEKGAFRDIKECITERIIKKIPESDSNSDDDDPKDFKFWEEAAGQADLKYRCYKKLDMVVIWLFTLGSGFFSGLFRWQIVKLQNPPMVWSINGFTFTSLDWVLGIACIVGMGVALWYLIRSITMERKF